MRHSRRAVMAERYKLYAKKNILNSRYLVRNLQISLLVFVLVAMVIGTVVIVTTDAKEDVVVADAKVSVKDALFSNTEEEVVTTEEVTEQQVTTAEVTESVFAEKVQNELDNTITDVVSNVVPKEKETEEPKSEFDNKCIAKVDETLNVRSNPSADAEFVGQMNNGAIAIVQGVEGDWTKIKSGDVVGYVLTEYVLTGATAEEFAKNYVTLRGTILEDGVNIRAEKSTDAEILVVMDKDEFVTVLENPMEEEEMTTEEETVVDVAQEATTEAVTESTTEAVTTQTTTEETTTQESATTVAAQADTSDKEVEEEIEWITVMLEDGKTGYVSADLVEIDELYEIAVSAEELQRRAEEEAARKAAEEEAARQAAAAAAQATQQAQNSNNSSNSYEGATTKPVTTTESGELIGTFTITAYCGCSKCGTGSNRTATGTTPTEGRTIAADTSILPFGTQVVIGGVVYTVEDTGSGVRGNHIDIFFATHARALAFGRKTMKVYKY
ncbi:MAG: hypothetical protein E7264_08290 [Lachnospiraceae bacterium]|nr:hypothetical protein [Lachnospiraceae bacterium]